jgi:NitT/TauT family transport system permease protein
MGLVCLSAPELVSGVPYSRTAPAPYLCMRQFFISMDWKLLHKSPRSSRQFPRWTAIASLIVALVTWELVSRFAGLPAFILPAPEQVAVRFWKALVDGSLLIHTATTLLEILLGLLAGMGAAILIGYAVAKSRLFEQLAAPYLVASQAIPVVAIAPLLVIWLGPGISSKVLICALIVFFPVLVNTVVGVRAVPKPLHDLMGSLRATRGQVLRYLELPAALPVLFGGLRVGATLSVIGAVVGELVGSDHGLGFLVNAARGQYDTALVFVAIFTLVALALALYGTVTFLERKTLTWQETLE